MMLIYLFMFMLAVDDIAARNSSSSSSSSRLLILPSCQEDANGLTAMSKSNDRQPYFHFVSRPSLSLSSSVLHLAYCEQQHTTYYLPSGFSILRSSPRLSRADIAGNEHASSFHPHHNTILSAVDQSTAPSGSNMITSLMSLSTPADKHAVVGSNHTLKVTTIKSVTTTWANGSSPHTSLTTTIQNGHRTFYVMLLAGCGAAGLLILIILYSIIKYYNRDEGSYKIDESKNFVTESHLENMESSICGGKISTSKHQRQKLLATNEQTLASSKEWYV